MTFGEKVKSLRANYNMSQETLAKELDINRNHLSRIETGLSEPTASILKGLAKVFDISIDSLLDIKTNDISNKEKLVKINEKCKRLSNEDLDFVIRMISIIKNEYVKRGK